MALWVRSGGYGGIRRFPGILLPRPLVAAERAWKKGIERKGWVRAMRCSLQWEADTQPRDEVREIVMEKGEVDLQKPFQNGSRMLKHPEHLQAYAKDKCRNSTYQTGSKQVHWLTDLGGVTPATNFLEKVLTSGNCLFSILPSSWQRVEQHIGINCDLCNGIGWLICDFCQGQKTNVKSESSSRFYRRCPYCKAVSLILRK
ncbi:hypothetical protein MA16_Dca023692 [Dendrobium catenatum]|uniref:Uncharacterized protein n=1 Tax=Dendrobium catenatum TaxID=906689 RepID=A0A2I0WC25_9ASPA|nr:hypothetical protein MA16_Dca023692 [Dendrobium catenatum]